MSQRRIITGLDIGTTKICAIIAEVNDNEILDIIGIGTSPSVGLRKGVVVDIDDTVSSIESAIEKAERMAGIEVDSVYVGIAGSHISSMNSQGVVAITGEDKEITQEDIDRVIEASQIVAIPPEREILHVLPRGFVIDGCQKVKHPRGMSGVRLKVETHIVTGSITSIENLVKSVNKLGIDVEDVVLEPLAASESVLSNSEKELGVVLVDIGGGTTDVAIFKEGSIWYTAVLPVGGDHITNDIAVGLRTPIKNAEKIKIKDGSALADEVSEKEKIDVLTTSGKETKTVSRKLLCEIIEPRIDEIFSLVQQEIYESGYDGLIPAGLVVTGGASLMPLIPELASEKLDLPVRRGIPDKIDDLANFVDDNIYSVGNEEVNISEDSTAIFATGVGLVCYGNQQEHESPLTSQKEGKGMGNILNKVKDWFDGTF
ncbi:cell division protein FtsA [Acetohalobium arabaticum]|uniref:Cell division protein FtsA n=1 Tax=Acetohalobium arabaticum (strain ATCC 49924 / DSM 5501 / Z-7288) TaxID=574087 RepID=D9QVN3_ACEAZ|nr:cell division protein FtsA [Acetohalobium arabaticum]ADL12292.1 cell division protein FtsA [Acetohalobium arabaticum DSM 5501]